jgi:hypothetical protein
VLGKFTPAKSARKKAAKIFVALGLDHECAFQGCLAEKQNLAFLDCGKRFAFSACVNV